jgi:serine/threonine protein kinase
MFSERPGRHFLCHLPRIRRKDRSRYILVDLSPSCTKWAKLGSGAFSTVVLCKAKSTGNFYAMKVVNRSSLTKALEEALKREISILNDLDHPNILSLVETFSTIKTHYLVTELVEGGELFDRIVEKSTYTESEARDVSRTLLKALKYCHSKFVCHRDLKVSEQ